MWPVLSPGSLQSAPEPRLGTYQGWEQKPDYVFGHIVGNHPSGQAAKPGPGILQPIDDVRELLGEGDVDVLVTAVDQDDRQGPGYSSPAGLRVGNQTQPAEIHLGHFPRQDVRYPHGQPLLAKSEMLHRIPMQTAVTDKDALTPQELVHLG